MIKKSRLIVLIFILCLSVVGANFVLAADFGTNAVGNGLGGSLTAADPRFLVGRIIQIILSFLGVIAILVIMYAGFLWMTSDGDEEKIRTAQGILRNAVIGLIIILSSWAIATFIISRLLAATSGENGFTPSASLRGFSSPGTGTIGDCTVESTYPENDQTEVPRNTSIMITFKEELKLDSVCVDNSGASCVCNNTASCNKINPLAIRLYKTDLGDACSDSCPNPNSNLTDVLVSVASGSTTLVIMPVSPLGSPTENISYSVKFNSNIKKLDNSSMFRNCRADFVDWKFTVNSNFDLTPPRVSLAGVFPTPDNIKDLFQEVNSVQPAVGSITVNACPHVYAGAKINSIVHNNIAGTATVTLNYHGPKSKFEVSVPADYPDQAQLFDGSGASLGTADFAANGQVVFTDYLTLKTSQHPVGSSWVINISPEQTADNLIVDGTTYVFATSTANNNILVPNNCNLNIQATNIQAKLHNPDSVVSAELSGNKINLTAKVAGQSGNDFLMSTTNPGALLISQMAGGRDRQVSYIIKDKKDKSRNSALQINFSEAVNPVTVSGLASKITKYIRVINAAAASSGNGAHCSNNSDCRSYKCEKDQCVGNSLEGKFLVSNGYKTVEFISDQECGLNGCGEKIYCLPENSHLRVELNAADLKSCSLPENCSIFSPYQSCSSTPPLTYNVCQNPDAKNYPLADLNNQNGLGGNGISGIVDTALNSLDGNRDTYADGPISSYNDNYLATSTTNLSKRDNYQWSFYINDQIMLTPPSIISVTPTQGRTEVKLADPLEIKFKTLMLNSTLRTGSVLINNGSSTSEHKLVNLRSSSPTSLGYWINSSNQDITPLDGEPDLTVANIIHSPFVESVTYKAQVGSGVKDIYQNCYKPSAGPGCLTSNEKPSCCFGEETKTLGSDGNCLGTLPLNK
ncbi:MAG: Ig-like domain-containing protein [Patescibacteria group bacterium]